MYCENCGNQIKDGALFCNKCGTKVDYSEDESVVQEQHSQQQKNFLTVYNDAVFSEEVA